MGCGQGTPYPFLKGNIYELQLLLIYDIILKFLTNVPYDQIQKLAYFTFNYFSFIYSILQ